MKNTFCRFDLHFWRFLFFVAVLIQGNSLLAEDGIVKASGFGWNVDDSTAALQAAFDSGARKVLIDRQVGDWITRPLFITNSNIEVVLADGVVIRAKQGEFREKYDCLIKIAGGVRNVVLRGEGKSTLAMKKTDYLDPSKGYPFSEWRHAVSILSANGVTVKNIEILESGGDGVYVNGANGVTLEDLVVRNHTRQGMSPISVTDMTVRRCMFNETSGTAPQCGVDMEPNREKDRFINVTYEDCCFSGNRSHGISLYFGAFTARSKPVSIMFRRCKMQGNGNNGLSFVAGNPQNMSKFSQVKGNVTFEECEFSGNGGEALKIVNHSTSGMHISFSGCVFDVRGSRAESALLFSNSQYPEDFGGLFFERCSVCLDGTQKVCDFEAMRGIGIGGKLCGTLTVDRNGGKTAFDFESFAREHVPHPEQKVRFDVAQVDFRELEAKGEKQHGKGVFTPYIRKPFVYVLVVPRAGEYTVRFNSHRIFKRGEENVCARVQLLDRAGTDLGRFAVPVGDFAYTVRANGPNVYRFETSLRDRMAIRVACDDAPGALLASNPVHVYHGDDVRLRFCVPPKAETVSVNISPQEPVQAELINAYGEIVERMPYQSKCCIMSVRKPRTDVEEIWTLRFVKISEDTTFQIGGDALPLASIEPVSAIGLRRGQGRPIPAVFNNDDKLKNKRKEQ